MAASRPVKGELCPLYCGLWPNYVLLEAQQLVLVPTLDRGQNERVGAKYTAFVRLDEISPMNLPTKTVGKVSIDERLGQCSTLDRFQSVCGTGPASTWTPKHCYVRSRNTAGGRIWRSPPSGGS